MTGTCEPRLNASLATLCAMVAVAVCVGSAPATACAHRSGLPSRLESAAQKWSRREMLTGTEPTVGYVPVATAPVTSGDAKNSLISTAKL